MRSMVFWTFRSRTESAGLRRARLRASRARQRSISARKVSSTAPVPRLPLAVSAYLSKNPRRMASRANIWAISSHLSTYWSKVK